MLKNSKEMETKTSAVPTTAQYPTDAHPLDRFLQSLPKAALFIGAKCYSTPEKNAFYVGYTHEGELIFQSFIWEGGAA